MKVCVSVDLRDLLDTYRIAMKRMAASNVLIVGMRGLGAEIGKLSTLALTSPVIDFIPLAAKNIVLAGVKSVTVFDPEPVKIQDLGTQVRFQFTCLNVKCVNEQYSFSFVRRILGVLEERLLFRVLLN